MRLYELESADAIKPRLVAIADQLHSDLENGEIKDDFALEELLQYFSDYDIVLDKADLFNMIKQPPLDKVIANIQGDKVVFKGKEDLENAPDQSQNQEVVKSMADRAVQNPK